MDEPTNQTGSVVEMESEDEEAAMAAAMGFSGFGKAPATKKRKYNSKTDAFVDGQDLLNIDKGGRKGHGSGGNEVPLGKMRVLGASSAAGEQSMLQANEEEIDLDMGEAENDDDRPMEERCLDTSRPAPAEEKAKNDARRAARRGKPMINEDEIMLDDDDDDDDGDNIPAPSTEADSAAQEAQAKIDAILAASMKEPKSTPISQEAEASAPKPKPKQKQKPKPAQGLAAFMSALQTPVIPPPTIPPPPGTTSTAAIIPPAPGTDTTSHTYSIPSATSLPQRPSQSAPTSSHAPSSAGSTAGGGRGGDRGHRNELWYVDYYDPSFNENPWKQLEKDNGLPSVGTWVERPPRNHQQRGKV